MNGFFAGGMAASMQERAELGLKRDALAQEAGLRTRALDIQETSMKNAAQRDILSRADSQIDDTMKIVGETISAGLAAGKDPVAIQKAIGPLVDSAKSLAAKAGRDPKALDSQVIAQLIKPTGVEAATAAGVAKATTEIAQENTLKAAGYDGLGKWKTLDEKVKAEGALRDDYLKQAQPFVTIRDAKNRLDNIAPTGAGDIALLFQYMKILDPGSTVREGEFATAASVAGVPGQIEGIRRQIVGGGRLSDSARKQIFDQSNKLYQAAALQHDKLTTTFANIAKKNRLDPNNTIPDILPAGVTKPDPLGIR